VFAREAPTVGALLWLTVGLRLLVAGAAVGTFGLGYLGLASAASVAVGLPMAVVAHVGVGA
jgi:hypothetical protein